MKKSTVRYAEEEIIVTHFNEEYRLHCWEGEWYMDITIHTFPEAVRG